MKKILLLVSIFNVIITSGCVSETNDEDKSYQIIEEGYKICANGSIVPKTTKCTINEAQPDKSDNGNQRFLKEQKNFSGYRICNFVFEYDQEKYVRDKEWLFTKFCNFSEGYPHIKDFLYNEYMIYIVDIYERDFIAWYYGDAMIVISERYKNGLNLDTTLSHEIAHSATEGLNLPMWLEEGIAEYSSYRFFGTEGKIYYHWFEGFEKWNDYNLSTVYLSKAYYHSAYVVKVLIDKYGDDFMRNLIIEINGKIDKNDDIDTKNMIILDSIRKVAGNESLTLSNITKPPNNMVVG